MWGLFLKDVAFAGLLLYLPGLGVWYGLSKNAKESILAAPMASIGMTYIIATIFKWLGVRCDWRLICLVLLCLVVVATVFGYRRPRNGHMTRFDVVAILMTICVSAIVSGYIYVKTLDGPASFMQGYDNYSHLYTVRDYVNSGFYSEGELLAYPCEWHCICGLVASFGMGEVTIGVNSVNYVLTALVFPLGIYLLLDTLFPNNKAVRFSVPFIVLANTALPWAPLAGGPLYAFALGVCILPYSMSYFVRLVGARDRKTLISAIFKFCVSLIVLALAHQSMVFVGVLLLLPCLVWTIWALLVERGATLIHRLVACAATALAVGVIWCVCYIAPAFQGVLFFHRAPIYQSSIAAANTLLLATSVTSVPQITLAVLTYVGIFRLLYSKQHRWLIASFAVAAFAYFASVGTSSELGHFLTGFWYNDNYRTSAVYAMASLPLSAIGLSTIVASLLPNNEDKVALASCSQSAESTRPIKAAALFLVLVALYLPSFSWGSDIIVRTPVGALRENLAAWNSLSEDAKSLTLEETEFLKQVKQVVGDAPVLNYPFDGSCYAYGVTGLNVINHKWWGYEEEDYADRYVRNHICEIATNERERELLEDKGINYIMMLDDVDSPDATLMKLDYNADEWREMEQLSDSTPGLEIVLSNSDMRLYRIVG